MSINSGTVEGYFTSMFDSRFVCSPIMFEIETTVDEGDIHFAVYKAVESGPITNSILSVTKVYNISAGISLGITETNSGKL